MVDREKVIKGLEQCKTNNGICHECPYDDGSLKLAACTSKLCNDAIELLKEQEAKKVNISQMHYGIKYGLCPRCEKQIDTLVNPHYCGNCGQELKWE